MPKPPTNSYLNECSRTVACSKCFLAHEHVLDLFETLEFARNCLNDDSKDRARDCALRMGIFNKLNDLRVALLNTPYQLIQGEEVLYHRTTQYMFAPRAPFPNLPHCKGRVCWGNCNMEFLLLFWIPNLGDVSFFFPDARYFPFDWLL